MIWWGIEEEKEMGEIEEWAAIQKFHLGQLFNHVNVC